MANMPLTSKQMSLEAVEIFRDAFEGSLRRWLVTLGDAPSVCLALDQVGVWPERKASNLPNTYFIKAKDELDAYMKARKMEAENNERD